MVVILQRRVGRRPPDGVAAGCHLEEGLVRRGAGSHAGVVERDDRGAVGADHRGGGAETVHGTDSLGGKEKRGTI